MKVNKFLQTSVKHIYAAGDCTGGHQFTHYAGWQSFVAVRNALMPGKSLGENPLLPWVTFTSPEVGKIGLSLAEAKAKYGEAKVKVLRWNNDHSDRSITDNDRHGFIELLALASGDILGCTVVGERAGELVSEVGLAMTHKIKVQGIALAIHAYPTYSFALYQLTSAFYVSDMLTGSVGNYLQLKTRLPKEGSSYVVA